MTSLINASTSAGVVITPDTSGVLALQTAGTTAVTVDASQNVTLAGTLTTTGITNSGVATATRFNPTGSSVTGNGMYLPAANSVGISTNGTNAVYIDSSQNVGIGTASPGVKLDVNGALRVGLASNPTTIASNSQFYDQSGVGPTISGYNFTVRTGNPTPAETFRIDSGGYVLVATTSTNPVASRVNGAVLQPSGGILSRSPSASSYFGLSVTSGVHISFYTDNGSAFVGAGNINSNGATTAYSATSDYRLKDNVQPLNNALSRVAQLNPVKWTWKEGYGGTQPECEGFIAHELAEILPIAVVGEKDGIDDDGKPVYQGIDTSFLVATLTAAIQEQQALITQLQADVAALKGK